MKENYLYIGVTIFSILFILGFRGHSPCSDEFEPLESSVGLSVAPFVYDNVELCGGTFEISFEVIDDIDEPVAVYRYESIGNSLPEFNEDDATMIGTIEEGSVLSETIDADNAIWYRFGNETFDISTTPASIVIEKKKVN